MPSPLLLPRERGAEPGMAVMVSLLGASPGTVHTALCKLLEEGYGIERVYILYTRKEYAMAAVDIIEKCPCTGSEAPLSVEVELVQLPFDDIRSTGDLAALRRVLGGLLEPSVVLDITGGRKLMAVAASLEALARGATIVSAIVPEEVYARLRAAENPCEKTAPREARLLIVV